jgi:hypothetical protein
MTEKLTKAEALRLVVLPAKRPDPPPLPLPTLKELLASREKVRARNSARSKLAWAKRKQAMVK